MTGHRLSCPRVPLPSLARPRTLQGTLTQLAAPQPAVARPERQLSFPSPGFVPHRLPDAGTRRVLAGNVTPSAIASQPVRCGHAPSGTCALRSRGHARPAGRVPASSQLSAQTPPRPGPAWGPPTAARRRSAPGTRPERHRRPCRRRPAAGDGAERSGRCDATASACASARGKGAWKTRRRAQATAQPPGPACGERAAWWGRG